MDEYQPVQVALDLSLICDIQTAIRDAAASAEERLNELCGSDAPTPQTMNCLPHSKQRLAWSFFDDVMRCRDILKKLEGFRS